MNALIGEKLSITAQKPQTTRHQILGIRSSAGSQAIFVDTPGIHSQQSKAINRYMNRAATSVLDDVDLICWLIDARRLTDEDERISSMLQNRDNVVVVLNKCDLVVKDELLPMMERLGKQLPGVDIVPVSALKQDNLESLMSRVEKSLPLGEPQFDDDQLTDRPMRFIVAEIVREKLFRRLSQELPYSVTVDVENYLVETDMLRISASIWVERKSQKGIVIGKGGALLKQIGSDARKDIEKLSGQKVYLQLWVKVREDWSDDERSLAAFGYSNE